MQNRKLADWLHIVGAITIAWGVVAGLLLVKWFSEPNLLSKGELSGTELLISLGVMFYHLVLGLLCFGIGHVLAPSVPQSVVSKATYKYTCTACGLQFEDDDPLNYCEICGGKLAEARNKRG